jgi:orotate phosphoribosyltransferase
LEAIELLKNELNVKVDAIVVSVDRRTKNQFNELQGQTVYSIITLLDIAQYLQSRDLEKSKQIYDFYEA